MAGAGPAFCSDGLNAAASAVAKSSMPSRQKNALTKMLRILNSSAVLERHLTQRGTAKWFSHFTHLLDEYVASRATMPPCASDAADDPLAERPKAPGVEAGGIDGEAKELGVTAGNGEVPRVSKDVTVQGVHHLQEASLELDVRLLGEQRLQQQRRLFKLEKLNDVRHAEHAKMELAWRGELSTLQVSLERSLSVDTDAAQAKFDDMQSKLAACTEAAHDAKVWAESSVQALANVMDARPNRGAVMAVPPVRSFVDLDAEFLSWRAKGTGKGSGKPRGRH